MDVEEEGNDQPGAQDPQRDVGGEERDQQLAESLGIFVDVGNTGDVGEEDLPVAHHVGHDEDDDHDPGDRHHPFLADRRSIEADRPRGSSLFDRGGHRDSIMPSLRPGRIVRRDKEKSGTRG